MVLNLLSLPLRFVWSIAKKLLLLGGIVAILGIAYAWAQWGQVGG